ncbi:MAG: cobalt ECF transporter T component CbiQ [Syntrophomonadaceae bacterium]
MLLPDWMNESDFKDKNPTAFKTGNNHYLIKSIRNMRKVICEAMQTEHMAKRDGLLQKFSPELKLVSMIILILGISLSRQIPVLLAMLLMTMLLMHLSRLPVLMMQKRIWGFIPLITLLFTMPMTLNIFIDGTPLIVLFQSEQPGHWLGINWPATIFISRQGVISVTFLFLRVGLSLSLGVLLIMTTPVTDIFKSLRVLRVPDLFIMILEMTYRYLMVLLSISIEMFEARKIRTVGHLALRSRQAQVGSSIAALFDRSMNLSEEVYQAMCARCYTGSIPEAVLDECGQLELIA